MFSIIGTRTGRVQCKEPNYAELRINVEFDIDYKWRTRTNEFIKPKEMDSKHLFYTWLMIYNHTVQPSLRIWNTHRYKFNVFYTNEYMQESFEQLYIELKMRHDLGPKMKEVISIIESRYVNKIKEGNKCLPQNELLT